MGNTVAACCCQDFVYNPVGVSRDLSMKLDEFLVSWTCNALETASLQTCMSITVADKSSTNAKGFELKDTSPPPNSALTLEPQVQLYVNPVNSSAPAELVEVLQVSSILVAERFQALRNYVANNVSFLKKVSHKQIRLAAAGNLLKFFLRRLAFNQGMFGHKIFLMHELTKRAWSICGMVVPVWFLKSCLSYSWACILWSQLGDNVDAIAAGSGELIELPEFTVLKLKKIEHSALYEFAILYLPSPASGSDSRGEASVSEGLEKPPRQNQQGVEGEIVMDG
eukprot:TRINITY_DN2142_c0_g1_i1.p1 TRINITY_DN2142_c0_g1~~TRINITY_DN2142_c0_g1_i1.p1  ORF type:complete len:281 (-),score=65.30 TRINITY_DN2142_c0_g1_i1:72-914(-)